MNEKKLGIHIALSGVIGYFAANLVYKLLDGGKNKFRSVLVGILGLGVAAIIGVLYHFYVKKKYPKLVKGIAAVEQDERGKLIRGKTSTYTLIVIAFLATGVFIYSILNEYHIISYMIAISYLITVAFDIAIKSHLNKNN